MEFTSIPGIFVSKYTDFVLDDCQYGVTGIWLLHTELWGTEKLFYYIRIFFLNWSLFKNVVVDTMFHGKVKFPAMITILSSYHFKRSFELKCGSFVSLTGVSAEN